MSKHGFALLVVAFILAVTFQEGAALKCWRCSSDASNAAFCDDPFDSSLITEQQRRWSFVDCSFPPSQLNPYSTPQSRPVCKKIKQLINEKVVVSRSCFWEDLGAAPDTCLKANTPSYIKTEFCETCSTDGCNGAAQYGPVAILITVPAIIAKMISL